MKNEKEKRFQEAVREHEAKLMGYAAFLLHGDVSRAQDVVQDCFFKLWQANYDSVKGHIGAWLFTVCAPEFQTTRSAKIKVGLAFLVEVYILVCELDINA